MNRAQTYSLIVCLLLCVTHTNAGKFFRTRGKSGPRCGGGPRCLGNNQTKCIEGKCVCREGDGIGHFVCPKKDEKFCAIFNDPMARGFDGSHVKLPLLLKFAGTRIMTRTCRANKKGKVIATDGQCLIRIEGWGGKRLGKTFLRGFEVASSIFLRGSAYHHATRITASARNGVYRFYEGGNRVPWGGTLYSGPVRTSIPRYGSIYTYYDDVDNFAVLRVEPCGVEIGIRGVEDMGDPLKTASGMYIKIKDGCQTKFMQADRMLCIPPLGMRNSLQEQIDDLSDKAGREISKETLALYKVVTSDVVQIFPNASDSLQALTDTCQECDVGRLTDALEVCIFIIHDPQFFNCYDASYDGTKGIELLEACIFSICDENEEVCGEVQRKIRKKKCRIYYEEPTIMDRSCRFDGDSPTQRIYYNKYY